MRSVLKILAIFLSGVKKLLVSGILEIVLLEVNIPFLDAFSKAT